VQKVHVGLLIPGPKVAYSCYFEACILELHLLILLARLYIVSERMKKVNIQIFANRFQKAIYPCTSYFYNVEGRGVDETGEKKRKEKKKR
jgi:hypothetical protein